MIQAAQRDLPVVGAKVAGQRHQPPEPVQVGQPPDEHVIEDAEALHQVELLVDDADGGTVCAERGAGQASQFLPVEADGA